MKAEELAEKIWDEAAHNALNFKNSFGISPTLKNDWIFYIEEHEELSRTESLDKLKEIREKLSQIDRLYIKHDCKSVEMIAHKDGEYIEYEELNKILEEIDKYIKE